tara:strand:+ start:364 stop:672 length:309 start_codon:yes stop_codon:yes gene_type:complete
VFGLCDCNPFGLSILLTYRRASSKFGADPTRYSVDIKWLGFRPSQVPALNLDKSAFQPMTATDNTIASNLLAADKYVAKNDLYKRELQVSERYTRHYIHHVM